MEGKYLAGKPDAATEHFGGQEKALIGRRLINRSFFNDNVTQATDTIPPAAGSDANVRDVKYLPQ